MDLRLLVLVILASTAAVFGEFSLIFISGLQARDGWVGPQKCAACLCCGKACYVRGR